VQAQSWPTPNVAWRLKDEIAEIIAEKVGMASTIPASKVRPLHGAVERSEKLPEVT
jgi:hypothetical protein